MNELSVVRLKDDYVFFQEDEYICVYRKSTKLVMLKLKAGKNAWNDAVKEDLNRPHQVQWLAKQPYWNWLGLLMLKYQDLFEKLSEAETDRAVQKSDFFSVVNPTHFAEGFQADTSFRQTKIYLWGVTALNMLLYETLKETIPAACVIRKEEDLADVNSFAGLDGEKRMEAAIPEEQIIGEDRSTSTFENMKYSKEKIWAENPDGKVAFSTTNYHVFRGYTLAEKLNFKVKGMSAKTKLYFFPNAFVREFIGLLWEKKWAHLLFIILFFVFLLILYIIIRY